MTFIDLDDVLLDDHQVRIGGEIYLLPGDLPIEQMLGLSRAWERMSTGIGGKDGDDLVDDLYQRVLELFRVRQPDLQELPIGVLAVARLIVRLYGGLDDEPAATPAAQAEGGGDPTPPPTTGAGRARGTTRTSKAKKKTRARSTA